MLHVSSIAALGEPKADEIITEQTHWESNTRKHGYGLSKYESEMEVWRGIAEGLQAVIVNPSIIIGKEAGWQGSGQLFKTVKNGLRYYPSGSCGLVAVDDVVNAMILLMNSSISAERFIINAENWSYQRLFTKIADAFGSRP